MNKILLVEDSDTIIIGLKYLLETEGFEINIAKNIKDTYKILENENFNLILLDINLPDGKGFSICENLKKNNDIPIIFLTARDEEKDIVEGLDIGADDYVTKPFRNRELISRINNVLRRYEKNNKSDNIIKFKDIKIDLSKSKVTKGEEEIIFTSLEYRILVMLFSNKDVLISREKILDKIWDVAGNFVNDNTLTVYIKRIREKLDDKDGNIIKTVRGRGYIIEGD